jgi:hypothetical protein
MAQQAVIQTAGSANEPTAEHRAPLGLFEKARVAAAIGAAVLLLYTIGWMVAQPTDPNLAVTFVRSGRAIPAVWPALAILSVVAGIVGTVIAGPRLPEAGLFAAAIGLAVLSTHGGSMMSLLANEGATDEPSRKAFMMAMLIDCALWSGIMFAAWIAVNWTYRWVWLQGGQSPVGQQEERTEPGKNAKPQAAGAIERMGWPALVVTGVVAVFIVWLTAGRTPVANVLRGQTIAAVAGGLYLGAMASRYFTGIRDVRFYLLAVPAAGLMAYVVGYLSADMSWAQGTRYQYYVYLATTPTHDLARPLPIEYLAVGTAAVLAGFWGGDKMEQVAIEAI